MGRRGEGLDAGAPSTSGVQQSTEGLGGILSGCSQLTGLLPMGVVLELRELGVGRGGLGACCTAFVVDFASFF